MTRSRAIAALFLALLPYPVAGAAGLGPEETLVRRAYARLGFATRISGLQDTAGRAEFADEEFVPAAFDAVVLAKAVTFEISNFRTGGTRELAAAGTAVQDLVTPPGGPSLEIDPGKWAVQIHSGGFSATTGVASARWSDGKPATGRWAPPAPGAEYIRYAAWEVTATLAGRQRRYQAASFFAPGKDPLILDSVVGPGALLAALHLKLDPAPLLRLVERTLALHEFLTLCRAAPDCVREQDSPLCCRLGSLSCGLLSH